MKELLLVGIGAGDPDYITQQAIKALRRSDVIFLMDKGPAKHKLNALRREICASAKKEVRVGTMESKISLR